MLLAVPLPNLAVAIVPEVIWLAGRLGTRATASVPLLMFPAFVVSVVADAANPLTAPAAIVAAVVRTPPVVVTTIWPLVEPMAPALVMLPWAWAEGANVEGVPVRLL